MNKKDSTMLEISKDTLTTFQIAKSVWQSEHGKKITNEKFLLELLK